MSLNSLGEDPEQSVLCVVDAHKAVTLGARWCFAGSRWRTTIPEFFSAQTPDGSSQVGGEVLYSLQWSTNDK